MRTILMLSFTALLTACGVFGPPEPPAPIEERATRGAVPTVQTPARAQPAPPPAAAPVAKAIPLPERASPPSRPRGDLAPPSEPERGFIIETPGDVLRGVEGAVDPRLPPGTEPLPPEAAGAGAAIDAQASALASLSPAVQSLVAGADAAAAEQNWDRAQASLERAVKLAPSKSVVWQKLAHTHLSGGDLDRAREVAQRALTLAPANSAEKVSAWQLIADIEQARGDVAAARAARDSATAIGASLAR